MKTKSEIDKIHELGKLAIIDGDRQVIVGSFMPNDEARVVANLEAQGKEVGFSGKDICFYTESDD